MTIVFLTRSIKDSIARLQSCLRSALKTVLSLNVQKLKNKLTDGQYFLQSGPKRPWA